MFHNQPDVSHYLGIADEAKKRAEKAEKENREVSFWLHKKSSRADGVQLKEELEQLRDQARNSPAKITGDRAFIWADEERSFPY